MDTSDRPAPHSQPRVASESAASLALLTVAEMRAAELDAIEAGTSGRRLMEKAGRAAAAITAPMLQPGQRVAVLCGPGNNGGDGFVIARTLRAKGFEVHVGLLGTIGALKGDAALAAAEWDGPIVSVEALDLTHADLVIDALFGTGLARDLTGDAAEAVRRINACGKPVVAVDLPSGIDSDTGAVRGVAVKANRTVTFAALKPGHLLYPGRDLAGEVSCVDIGIARPVIAAHARTFGPNGPTLWLSHLPRPMAEGHKFDRGHAVVLSGGGWMTGAARLAARGALRSGAGLVTIAAPLSALPIHAARLDAVMLRPCESAQDLAAILTDHRFNCLVLGPGAGVGTGLVEAVRVAISASRALVLDADAISSFARQPDMLAGLIRDSRNERVVLTPHEGEFARLFGREGEFAPEQGRLARARAAALRIGAVVLLKGPDTVIAAPDGRAIINANGSPYLATAGSGDVLAGFIAGLMAQGMPPFEAAAASAWMHGEIGQRIGPGLISEDLPDGLPPVLRALLG